MRNHKIVLSMRVIKHVLSEFIGLFVCMYLLNLADGGISTVVGYNIIVVSITYLFLAGSGSIAKTSRRTILMHAGIILHVIYFAVVALMGPAVTKFFYIPAILMGMSEGLYWSCFDLVSAFNRMIEILMRAGEDGRKFFKIVSGISHVYDIQEACNIIEEALVRGNPI